MSDRQPNFYTTASSKYFTFLYGSSCQALLESQNSYAHGMDSRQRKFSEPISRFSRTVSTSFINRTCGTDTDSSFLERILYQKLPDIKFKLDVNSSKFHSLPPESDNIWMNLFNRAEISNAKVQMVILLNSLYGFRKSPKLWYKHLSSTL